MEKNSIKTIGVFGGGTAGWLTACYLARRLKLSVSLIENPNIPKIGVGESTVPNIVEYLKTCGVDEAKLFEHAHAIRKYASIHYRWFTKNEHPFLHRFVLDESQHDEHDYWHSNYLRPTRTGHHAYHIDAQKLPALLRTTCPEVKWHLDNIEDIVIGPDGIESVRGEKREYRFDLYIDCTGQKKLLRSKFAMDLKGHDIIRNNCAWVGHKVSSTPAIPMTQTFAMRHGWRWVIGLQHCVSNGYVFCDDYVNIDEAAQDFMNETGLKHDQIRLIRFSNHYLSRPWIHNMYSCGLASGFLEPLESTSIYTITFANQIFARFFEKEQELETINRLCNKAWQQSYNHLADFISHHYLTSDLSHTKYWSDIAKIASVHRRGRVSRLFSDYSYQELAKHRGLSYFP